MIHWDTGTVIADIRNRQGIQEIRVLLSSGDEASAIHYTDVSPALRINDIVLLNTTAVDLKLGTGGFHFVHTILAGPDGRVAAPMAQSVSPSLPSAAATAVNPPSIHQGHMMKLRYTSLQRAIFAAEEQGSPHHELFKGQSSLEGLPVLIGELHSMLPIVVCWLRFCQSQSATADSDAPQIAYVMSDGGALPIAFSNHVSLLRSLGWLIGTVTYGQAYGGDIEAMNKFTGLIAAKHILQADIAMVSMGPGIAGTGTWMGYTGIEVGEIVNAVQILGGIPIVIPRISFADPRDRHQGLSHHILTALTSVALQRAVLPLPSQLSGEQKARLEKQIRESGCERQHEIQWISDITNKLLERSLEQYPLKITTMGRGQSEDAAFFLGAAAAAHYARNCWSRTRS